MSQHVTVEVAGLAGFDWLMFDGEHAPTDIPVFLKLLQGLQNSDSAIVGRPSVNDPVQIKQMLDIGFYNLLIPFVESTDQARVRRGCYPLSAPGPARRVDGPSQQFA